MKIMYIIKYYSKINTIFFFEEKRILKNVEKYLLYIGIILTFKEYHIIYGCELK